jgi:hypothetical protein
MQAADSGPDPRRVIADARRSLELLLRMYYLRYSFEAMELFIVIPLMLVGYDCDDAIDGRPSPDRLERLRSTLILVELGLYYQRRNHYLTRALYRVLRGRMQPSEIALLQTTVNMDEDMGRNDDEESDESNAEDDLMRKVRSKWPVCVVKKNEDVQTHVLGNLVKSYAGLNIAKTSPD